MSESILETALLQALQPMRQEINSLTQENLKLQQQLTICLEAQMRQNLRIVLWQLDQESTQRDTARLGRAVGEIGTVVKQLEHRDAKQYQLTTANLHILGELESTIESQQRELQQARRHSVLGAIDNPHQPQPNRPVKKTTQNHQHPPTPTAISPKSSAPKES
jgi:hypothetical protein